MFPNIPLQWVTAQDLIMALHAYSGWRYNLSSYFLFWHHEQLSLSPPLKQKKLLKNPYLASTGPRNEARSPALKACRRERHKDEEKLGREPERQIGLASIGLKVKRRDNKQEKLPVITGFNIFLFLCDPFLLSLPLSFLSFFSSRDPRLKTDLLKLGLICNALWTLGVNPRFVI